jgi:hypothetical protein
MWVENARDWRSGLGRYGYLGRLAAGAGEAVFVWWRLGQRVQAGALARDSGFVGCRLSLDECKSFSAPYDGPLYKSRDIRHPLYVSVAFPYEVKPSLKPLSCIAIPLHTMANKPTYAAVAANESSPKTGKNDAPVEAPPPCTCEGFRNHRAPIYRLLTL